MNKIVDSHCHLDFKVFENDLENIFRRASENNVKYFLSISVDFENFKKIKKLVKKYEVCWCTTGIHPNNVKEKINLENIYVTLKKNLEDEKVVGLGETGLDFFRSNKNINNQINCFKQHIKVSIEKKIPLVIHSRSADDKMIDIFKTCIKQYKAKGLIHCFSSKKKLARIALDCNFFISFSGIVTFNNSHDLVNIVKYIPLEKILVETDSPFLSPIPHRGKRNEPSFIVNTIKKIAEIKNLSFEEVVFHTTSNFFSLFDKIKKGI